MSSEKPCMYPSVLKMVQEDLSFYAQKQGYEQGYVPSVIISPIMRLYRKNSKGDLKILESVNNHIVESYKFINN